MKHFLLVGGIVLSFVLSGCEGKQVPDTPPSPTPLDTEVADKEGYTVKGLVTCGGKALPGVIVSDGVNVTQTNLEGKYWMKTDERSDFVFLTIPSGYEVPLKGNNPQFYHRLKPLSEGVQRFDFSLTATDNQRYELLVFTDIHISARTTPLCLDSDRFTRAALADLKAYVATLPYGTKFYGLSLGDQVQDSYIKDSGLPEFLDVMSSVPFPMFYIVGNHDHLPDAPLAEDENARSLKAYYMDHLGPTYYSFNLGKVHYVVLDNNMMLGGGTNKYRCRVPQQQLDWMAKDLAKVDKSMKLVVCLHQPIVHNATDSGASLKVSSSCENYQDIANACAGFGSIEVFTGHSHFAEVVNWSARFTQTTHPSACGVWWLSKFCHDGTPAAYTRYEVDGTEMRRSLMAYDYPAHPQVFVHTEGVTDPDGKPAIQFSVPFYGNGWKVRVTENGEEVAQASRVLGTDWYYEHTEYPAQPAFQQKYATVQPRKTWHIFYYTPVDPSASVEVEATDPWGRKGLVYAL